MGGFAPTILGWTLPFFEVKVRGFALPKLKKLLMPTTENRSSEMNMDANAFLFITASKELAFFYCKSVLVKVS